MSLAGEVKSRVLVSVALGVPGEEPYQYLVPEEMVGKIKLGIRVRVPLGASERFGYVVGVTGQAEVAEAKLKAIAGVVEDEVLLPEHFLELTKWMAEYYFCSWGQALECVMPAPFKKGRTTIKARVKKKGVEADKELVHATPLHDMTPAQTEAYSKVRAMLQAGKTGDFLLHGVTGSGKTEIYLKLIADILAEGRSAIVLVPEISLTPQTTERFLARFGDRVAVVHSRLSAGKRLEAWWRAKNGEAQVVVGPRSALFSPVRRLALVVIDEEHDDSYKQGETPRYETGQVARKRCELEGACLLRASATPSLESFEAARTGQLSLLELPGRILNRPMPEVTVVDMHQQKAGRATRLFSIPLENAMREALKNGEQTILLLNRRGYAPFISCPACGFLAKCPRCHVSLVFHQDGRKNLCHLCHFTEPVPSTCPSCSERNLRFLGSGTEKVEGEALRLFPGARVVRMDRDATAKQGEHERILDAFRRRQIDILLGTQMVAKGHDFPDVSVIGVISADVALNLADFRAAERTFSLLTQVAGRAGRKDIPGRVFIQTFSPSHYAIAASKLHDYAGFFAQESAFRKELSLPPSRHLVQIIFAGRVEPEIFKKALEFKKAWDTSASATASASDAGDLLLGPAPCLIPRKFNQYLWNIFIKTEDVAVTNRRIRETLKSFDRKGVQITVDVDPR
jgi:primosomal protein N' (replication factor Y)